MQKCCEIYGECFFVGHFYNKEIKHGIAEHQTEIRLEAGGIVISKRIKKEFNHLFWFHEAERYFLRNSIVRVSFV